MNEEDEVNEIEKQIHDSWRNIQFGVKREGPYKTVVIDDLTAMAAVEQMGGWIKLCDMRSQHRAKKHFIKAYEALLMNPPRKYPNKLKGLLDECGTKHTPNLLGCPDTCLRIYRGET